MTEMKMTDQVTGYEIAGQEFEGHKNARHEIAAGHEIAGQKWKMHFFVVILKHATLFDAMLNLLKLLMQSAASNACRF